MDWGFNPIILSLTKHKINTIRNVYENATRMPEELTELFYDKNVFLFQSLKYTLRPEIRDYFSTTVALVDTSRVFYQNNGEPVAYLVQATKNAINENV